MDSRFNRHSERLAERHGTRVWRLGIDAGFTCPHREGGRGRGGCAFCAPGAGLAPYQRRLESGTGDLEAQIGRALSFARQRYGAKAFFLYFQAYSCTNLPVDRLERVYGDAMREFGEMAPGTLKGIVVSTRPDCLDREKARLLASYIGRGLEVWLELGLQSSSDATLARVNRGHTSAAYAEAAAIAGEAGLRRAAHVILGLPGEGRREMLETIAFAARAGLEGIKFHDLRIAKGSALANSLPAGEFSPLHPSRLPALLADCIERLPPQVEVMRLCADFAPSETIDIFPPPEKFRLTISVEEELERRGARQGTLWR